MAARQRRGVACDRRRQRKRGGEAAAAIMVSAASARRIGWHRRSVTSASGVARIAKNIGGIGGGVAAKNGGGG